MSATEPAIPTALGAALDAALTRVMPAPSLPVDFRERLRAAIARSSDTESLDVQRAWLEREHRAELAELEHGYLRLHGRTLTARIGGTVAPGAGVALLFPWLNSTFGAHVTAVAIVRGIFGLVIGAGASRDRELRFLA